MTAMTAMTEIGHLPCRAHDPELWFSERVDQIMHAQRLCATCPLQDSCLDGAIERNEPWGVWGGELFELGLPVPRKRRPGRPRKDDHVHLEKARHALTQRLSLRTTTRHGEETCIS